MASSASALTGTQTTANSATSLASGNSTSAATPTEGMFLSLLVAQIQNQDPLNPTDSSQFVSQLAQISELEQTVGIRTDIETYMGSQSGSSQTGNTASQTGNTSTQTTSTEQTVPTGTSLL